MAAITVRRVAAELGVMPMALYRHVGGKDGLLDAIVDDVYGQIELPARDELDRWNGSHLVSQGPRRLPSPG